MGGHTAGVAPGGLLRLNCRPGEVEYHTSRRTGSSPGSQTGIRGTCRSGLHHTCRKSAYQGGFQNRSSDTSWTCSKAPSADKNEALNWRAPRCHPQAPDNGYSEFNAMRKRRAISCKISTAISASWRKMARKSHRVRIRQVVGSCAVIEAVRTPSSSRRASSPK